MKSRHPPVGVAPLTARRSSTHLTLLECVEKEPASKVTAHARFRPSWSSRTEKRSIHYSLMRVVTAKLVAHQHERISTLADELARHSVMTGEAVMRLLDWPTRNEP